MKSVPWYQLCSHECPLLGSFPLNCLPTWICTSNGLAVSGFLQSRNSGKSETGRGWLKTLVLWTLPSVNEPVAQMKPSVYVTYNGDYFDFPFLEVRAQKYGMDMRQEIGFQHVKSSEFLSRACPHLDCLHWVNRDSYLPQGSRGLKVSSKPAGWKPHVWLHSCWQGCAECKSNVWPYKHTWFADMTEKLAPELAVGHCCLAPQSIELWNCVQLLFAGKNDLFLDIHAVGVECILSDSDTRICYVWSHHQDNSNDHNPVLLLLGHIWIAWPTSVGH